MKKLEQLLGIGILSLLLSSCYVETIITDDFITASPLNTDHVLQSYDLWYIDINETQGNGEVPFLQRAFTISFDNGAVYANNNLAGIGKTGNGYGIQVGFYNLLAGTVEIDHDVDGLWLLDVFAVNGNTIELYDTKSDTSYYLNGYHKNSFDFDYVFYDNINFFLQEYVAWEKGFTSEEGEINDFDDENFLQFQPGFFRSSIDPIGTAIANLEWDFEGNYQVYDVENDEMLKTLTLGYDDIGNDYFELYVINDSTIELYHPSTQTVYEFDGKNYIQFLKSSTGSVAKKRTKTSNPTMKVKRSRTK